jgi:septum formation topological specificity factor MinE
MKKTLYIIGLALAVPFYQLVSQDCDYQKMSTELEAAYNADQQIRRELMEIVSEYQKTGKGTTELINYTMKMDSIDLKNQELLDIWYAQCGWPNELSEKAHNAVLLIVQHANINFINKYINELKTKVDIELLTGDDYAILFDRKMMYEGKAQHYGTQTFQSPSSKNLIWPVIQIDSLDIRRAAVGLPSMQHYFKIAKDSMNFVMELDSTLTLEQAIEWTNN